MHDIRIPRNSCSKPRKWKKYNFFGVIQRLNLAYWKLSSSKVSGKRMSPLEQRFKVGEECEPPLHTQAVSCKGNLARRQGHNRDSSPQVLPPSQARLESEHASMLWRRVNMSCLLLAWSGQVFRADPPDSMQG